MILDEEILVKLQLVVLWQRARYKCTNFDLSIKNYDQFLNLQFVEVNRSIGLKVIKEVQAGSWHIRSRPREKNNLGISFLFSICRYEVPGAMLNAENINMSQVLFR